MKITPVSGPNQGSVEVSSGQTSPERKAAAKEAFLGHAKITPVESAPDPKELIQALGVPKIKMKTNANPERFNQEAEEIVQPQSAIQDPSETIEPEVTRTISPQAAAMAKQRRALQVKEQEIAAREKALLDKPSLDEEAYRAKLRANSLAELKAAGVTYEKLTEDILAEQSGQDPRIRSIEERLDAQEKAFEKKLADRDSQAETQVLNEMSREAKNLVKTDPEFEMVRETGSESKIVELIHRTWKASGEILDVGEAAKLVEDQLVQDGLKLANFGKVRSRLTPEQQAQAQPQQRQPGIRTLTNRDSATRPASARARAIAAFNGTLKR